MKESNLLVVSEKQDQDMSWMQYATPDSSRLPGTWRQPSTSFLKYGFPRIWIEKYFNSRPWGNHNMSSSGALPLAKARHTGDKRLARCILQWIAPIRTPHSLWYSPFLRQENMSPFWALPPRMIKCAWHRWNLLYQSSMQQSARTIPKNGAISPQF